MRKLSAVILVLLMLSNFPSNAFSYWGHYHYHDGHYYRHAGWWGWGGFATGLAVGAVVASLPPHYETVTIDGAPYYYYDGYYYQSSPGGYVIVQPPAGQAVNSDPSGSAPEGPGAMTYILGTLLAILLLGGIGLVVKKLFTNEHRTA